MKAEIENKIMLLVNGVYLAGYCDGGQKTNIRIEVSEQATSSLTSLIIKWLEKADICDECKNKLLTNLTDRI